VAKAAKNPWLAAGVLVVLRKQKVPAIIRQAKGRNSWEVELLDLEDGTPNGVLQSGMKSAMLRHPKAGEFPFLQVDDSSSDSDAEEANAAEILLLNEPVAANENIEVVIENREVNVDADSEESEEEQDSSSSEDKPFAAAHEVDTGHGELSDSKEEEEEEDQERQGNPPALTATDVEDSEEEQDPDEELEEDIPSRLPDDEEDFEQAIFNAADFAAARGIEVSPDRHKLKWDKYILEKQALIDQKWCVEVPAPKRSALRSAFKSRRGEV
jgi:hypothetical protein